jgi:hypothetical protein
MNASPIARGFMVAAQLEIRQPTRCLEPCLLTMAIDQKPRGKPDVDLRHWICSQRIPTHQIIAKDGARRHLSKRGL